MCYWGENLNFAISQKAAFESNLVKYRKPEKVVSAPLINGSYVMGITNRKSLKLIKKGDLLIDGNIIYATISNREPYNNPEKEESAWVDYRQRIAFNCASGTFARLSSKTLAYNYEEIFSTVVDEPDWELPTEKNSGSPHTFICSMKKVPYNELYEVLNGLHSRLIGDLESTTVRVYELFDPEFSTTELTPLGQYLQSTIDSFSDIYFFVDAWAELSKQ